MESPWLFNWFKDEVVREWKERIMNAVVSFNEGDRRQCSEQLTVCG